MISVTMLTSDWSYLVLQSALYRGHTLMLLPEKNLSFGRPKSCLWVVVKSTIKNWGGGMT